MLASSPKLTERFFRTLAGNIAHRTLDTVKSLAAGEVEAQQEDGALLKPPSLTPERAFELARRFEEIAAFVLDAAMAEEELVAYVSDCRVTEEREGRTLHRTSAAKVVLWRSHVCSDEPAWLGLGRRRALPLVALLGVTSRPSNRSGLSSDRDWYCVVLQMKSSSIRFDMEEGTAKAFAKAVERLRLRATNEAAAAAAAVASDKAASGRAARVGGSILLGSVQTLMREGSKVGDRGTGLLGLGVDGEGVRVDADTLDRMRRASLGSTGGGGAPSRAMAMAELSAEQWAEMLKGALYKEHSNGELLIAKGSKPDGIVQVACGTYRVEVEVPGRPQAQVFGHLSAGEVIGEMSFLLGAPASANVVAEAERCATIRFPRAYLSRLFADRPDIASTYYCFLATRAADRLKRQTSMEAELVMDESSSAPKSVAALTQNEAFFSIFGKFVLSEPRRAEEYGAMLGFVDDVFRLQVQPSTAVVRASVVTIYDTYIAASDPAGQSASPPMRRARTASILRTDAAAPMRTPGTVPKGTPLKGTPRLKSSMSSKALMTASEQGGPRHSALAAGGSPNGRRPPPPKPSLFDSLFRTEEAAPVRGGSTK